MKKVKNIYVSKIYEGKECDEYSVYLQLEDGTIIQANSGCSGTSFLSIDMFIGEKPASLKPNS